MPQIIDIMLFITAFLACAINSIAGGGTLLVFPSLIFAGLTPLMANATSTVALWPGQISAAYTYKRVLPDYVSHMPAMFIISVVGGLIGALLLIRLPESVFESAVPFLILGATIVFIFGRRVKLLFLNHYGHITADGADKKNTALMFILQFITAVYGGYFGAGIGIVMLALFALTSNASLNESNGLKTLLATAINSTAVLIFVYSGLVDWSKAIVMAIGGALGGYFGARLAIILPEKYIRSFVTLCGLFLSAYFFYQKAY